MYYVNSLIVLALGFYLKWIYLVQAGAEMKAPAECSAYLPATTYISWRISFAIAIYVLIVTLWMHFKSHLRLKKSWPILALNILLFLFNLIII